MKIFGYIFCLNLLLIFTSCTEKENQHSVSISNQIDSLIQVKDFFSVRNIFSENKHLLPKQKVLQTEIELDFAFNKPEDAIKKINALLLKHGNNLTDSVKYTIEKNKHIHYSRLYEYKNAAQSIEHLLNTYTAYLDKEETESLKNTLIIWNALQNQPKQQVTKSKSLNMLMQRDLAGLQNLEITQDTIKSFFVFDTGANISTITQSTANQMRIEPLGVNIEVQTITGEKVFSDLGVASSFFIGEIEIKNAVFLIFPDEALAFPQIGYQIHGILGFPVLEALEEIHLTKDDYFTVPLKPEMSNDANLAIDFLTPILWLEDSRGNGMYTLDTGANSTMLYDTYYKKYEDELSKQETVEYAFGGAGGQITQSGIYTTFTPKIKGREITIDSVMVLKKPLKENNFYLGNIGQDFIGKFQKIILNFKEPYLAFEQ